MGKILTLNALLLLLSGFLYTGCNSSGCTDNQNSLPLAGFYSAETGKAISLQDVEIGGVNAPQDSLLYSGSGSMSEIYLPFRTTENETSFYIHYTQEEISDPAYNDTITFNYTSQPYFASEECGAMYRYFITGLRYTVHIIDSVAITDSLITNIDIQRIKIFVRTAIE